ncbi:SulP family inorganic anion transporter [Methylogaea oryzae]|nr:SulP family inorganic anion transporter [Methylogaea oryzae]
MGRIVKQVPHSIIVGFTIGIAVSIAVTQGTEVLGVQATAEGHGAWPKLQAMLEHFGHLNLWAVVLAVGSVLFIKLLLRVSVFIPAPLLAIAAAIGLSQTWLADANLDLVVTKYGAISAKSLQFAAPSLESLDISMFGDIAYYAIAIVFVAAIESLLCAHLADRLAGNRGTPFNADKELWGQGHLMVLVPLLNGFPSTGALARTATNIKLGAVSPLSGVFNFVFQLLLAYYVAHYLELVPMACIAGILLYVAMNMVKREEVEEVLSMGHGHTA